MPTGVYPRKKKRKAKKKVQSFPLAMIPAKPEPVARPVRDNRMSPRESKMILVMAFVQTVRDILSDR